MSSKHHIPKSQTPPPLTTPNRAPKCAVQKYSKAELLQLRSSANISPEFLKSMQIPEYSKAAEKLSDRSDANEVYQLQRDFLSSFLAILQSISSDDGSTSSPLPATVTKKNQQQREKEKEEDEHRLAQR